jgi:hypothetical protein
MPLPPRVRTNERTDALFSEPKTEAAPKALPATPQPQQPPAPQSQPQNRPDQRPSSRKPAAPLEPAPSPRLQATPTPRETQPPFGAPPAPTRPQRPQSNPAAPKRPEEARPSESGARPVRRTASIFPTPSVAMTGSMPLPPRTRSRGRTEALFGDVEPAIDTQMTPMPVQAVQEAARRAAREASEQALEKARQSRQPAQFAQPPVTRAAANPMDSGPIPTAAAARTAAGMRAGRPASRPIEDPQIRSGPPIGQSNPGGWNLQNQNPAAPSLFAPIQAAFDPTGNPTGNPGGSVFGAVPGGDAPGAGVASTDEAGQHAGMGSERAAGPGRHRGPAGGRDPGTPLPWHEGWANNPQSLQPPSAMESSGPFPIVIPPDAPPKGQSRKVLFGVLLVFLVLLLIAAWSLRGLVSGSDDNAVSLREQGPVITTAPVAAETSIPGETAAASLAPAPTATPSVKAVPVEIRSATAIDPQGDGEENGDRAPLAVDGKKSTTWGSKTYTTANFGQLKKGLGLAIELRRSAAVSSAQIDVAGTGGRVQVRTADQPEYEGSTSFGSGSFEDGKVTIDAKGDVDASKYVIVWFTQLPSVEGKYRLEVSEVRLT